MYESKYKSRGASIEIIDHNEHAWNNLALVFPEKKKEALNSIMKTCMILFMR